MSKRTKTLLAIVAVVVVAGAGAVWWFLRDDAPAEVSLSAATESLDDGTTTSTAGGDTADSEAGDEAGDGAADGISGTWTVDATTGDADEGTGTFAGFRIEEELSGIGSTTAVGRTTDVSGTVEIDGTTVTAAEIEVDMTTITTNDSRRDGKVQSALDTDQFPTATFSLTEPIDLGDAAASGEAVTVTATGDLTISGVTNQVEMPIEAQLVDGTVALVGSVELTFADYDVEVPTSPAVLSVSDTGTLEVQLILSR